MRAVVGNPPYQDSSQADRLQSPPIFHKFSELAQGLASEKVSLVFPARWLAWTRGELGAYRTGQLASRHYSHFRDFPAISSLFPSVGVAGGLCFFLWSRAHDGPTLYSHGGEQDVARENILGPSLVREPKDAAIAEKILSKTRDSVSLIVGAYGQFLGAEVTRAKLEAASSPTGDSWVYYLRQGAIAKTQVHGEFLRCEPVGFKVFVSKTANSSQGLLRRADRIFVAGPGEAASVSFLQVGPFATRQEAENCMKYLKTDLANFLMGVKAATHNTTSPTYGLIPLPAFATGTLLGANLDFNGDLDVQLAKLFGLTEQERTYMASRLKAWPAG